MCPLIQHMIRSDLRPSCCHFLAHREEWSGVMVSTRTATAGSSSSQPCCYLQFCFCQGRVAGAKHPATHFLFLRQVCPVAAAKTEQATASQDHQLCPTSGGSATTSLVQGRQKGSTQLLNCPDSHPERAPLPGQLF